jgi:hypothetical protein
LNPVVFQYTATDGAEFTIEVKQENGKISKVFSRYIDPKRNPAERHWMSGDIDLSTYRGASITLLLFSRSYPRARQTRSSFQIQTRKLPGRRYDQFRRGDCPHSPRLRLSEIWP